MPTTSTAPARTAYTALGWVVLFFALHLYWYLGGSFASPGALPGVPQSLPAWIFTVTVAAAFPLGAATCLTIARGWAHGRLARIAAILVWTACLLLLVRGCAGIVDDLTRATAVLPNGITGLSTKQTTGATDLSWSGWAIDAYFLAGGIIFCALAVHYRKQQAHLRRSTGTPPGPAIPTFDDRPAPLRPIRRSRWVDHRPGGRSRRAQ